MTDVGDALASLQADYRSDYRIVAPEPYGAWHRIRIERIRDSLVEFITEGTPAQAVAKARERIAVLEARDALN